MLTVSEFELMKSYALSLSYDTCELPDQCPFKYDSLISLRNQLVVRKLKVESRKVDNLMRSKFIAYATSSNPKYYKSLLQISIELSCSSYKLAKSFLEQYFPQKPVSISTFLEDPVAVIPLNHQLRQDLIDCISLDPVCSLEANLIAECYGREYEELLISSLNKIHLCFETEADLRLKGKSKTPDILFLIPMAFLPLPNTCVSTAYNYTKTQNNPNNSTTTTTMTTAAAVSSSTSDSVLMEPHIINWIDSKAIFADEDTVKDHLSQFKAYFNRCLEHCNMYNSVLY